MKKIILTLAMMLVVSTISIAQINLLNLNLNNVDTLNSTKSNVSFTIDISAISVDKIISSININSGTTTNNILYDQYLSIDTVNASSTIYGEIQDSIGDGLSNILNANINNKSCRVSSTLWFLCPLPLGNFQDTLVLHLDIFTQDTISNQVLIVDTVIKIPLVIQFNQLPTITYNSSNGMLSMTAGDWQYATTSSVGPGAWAAVGPMMYFHFTNDTTINLWSYLNANGYTDSCTYIYLLIDEQWCSFDGQIVCQPEQTSLPVDLVSFEGSLVGESTKLHWKVGNEISFSHYEIEKSSDEKDFQYIGSVEVTDNNDYYFWDHKMIPDNKNYYRLKMIDTDGKYKYSQIVIIESIVSQNIYIYPNPTTGILHFTSPSTITVSDVFGNIVIAKKNTTMIDLSNQSIGIYFLKMSSPSVKIIKIIKQ